MSLDAALDAFASSEPFERLLLERARPVLARAATGEDVVVAALARTLDVPVLAVAPGPHEAEALAADLEALLGPDGAALLPSWEALPYEGIGPSPEVAARRHDALHRFRAAPGAFVLVAPVLAAIQRLVPTLGAVPPLDLVPGRELPPDELAAALVELGCEGRRRRAPRRVRGPRRRRGRVPGPSGGRRPGVLGRRSGRSARSRSRRSCPPRKLPRLLVTPVRELIIPDRRFARARARARTRWATGSPTRCSGSVTASSWRRPRRSRRSCSTRCRPRPSCCRPAPGSC
ncbi:MAG: hypothetical protein U0V56_09520 [Actinomycetota bacterium]